MTLQKDIPTIAKAMAQLLLYTDNGKGRGRDERAGEDSGSERGAGSGKGEGRRKGGRKSAPSHQTQFNLQQSLLQQITGTVLCVPINVVTYVRTTHIVCMCSPLLTFQAQ